MNKINHIYTIPENGIILSEEGKYIFNNDIYWNPINNNSIAIIIKSDNIILDMKCFKLVNTTITNNFIIGIFIDNCKNVIIKNGSIHNMTYYGVKSKNSETVLIKNIHVSNILLENLDIRNLTPTGIFIENNIEFTIKCCKVNKLNVKCDSLAGIQIVKSMFGNIDKCIVCNLLNKDGAVQGISLLECEYVKIFKCKVKKFKSEFNGNILTTGHTVIGYVPILSNNIELTDCIAESLYGSCDDCHGGSIFLSNSCIVNNFYANKIYDGVKPYNSGAKATGLEIYGNNVVVNDSFVENIIAYNPQDKQSTGFSVAGYNIEYNNCKAKNIIAKKISKQCKCNGKLVNNEDIYGIGFGWAPDPREFFRVMIADNIRHKNCVSENCDIGYDTWFHINCLYNNVKSINCNINILINPNEKRTLSCNPCSECNPPINITLANISYNNKIINF